MAEPTPPSAAPDRCPHCGGPLEGPISGEVQCYLYCPRCHERFDPWDAVPGACA
jgi:hypothetical protein